MVAQYFPKIFDVADMRKAKEIILTAEGPGADTETRWALETPYVLELISQSIPLAPNTIVLDYGCGIGRMAKAIIDAFGCGVIGVDISPSMRKLAPDYVGSDRFLAVTPGQFDMMVGAGLRVQAAISVWVLQHCFAPADDIARIRRGLASDGRLFTLNMPKRAIPAVVDAATPEARFVWAADKIDLAGLLRAEFHLDAEGVPDPSRTPNMAEAGTFWMHLRQRAPDAPRSPAAAGSARNSDGGEGDG
jgi:SAM-dependent methyltransferase